MTGAVSQRPGYPRDPSRHDICRNHPSNDGNKRVAVLAALIFLKVNGVESLPAPDDLETATLHVASGAWGKEELTDWLRREVGGLPLP